VAAAAFKAAAVDIDDNGQLPLCLYGSKDVEEEAIFAIFVSFALAEFVIVKVLFYIFFFVIKGPGLVGASAIPGGIVNTLPAFYLLGIFPPTGGGITNALISNRAGVFTGTALHIAAGCMHNIFHKFLLRCMGTAFAVPLRKNSIRKGKSR
jgi:hypothetical protein